ncbi:MAG: 50S ribosomal protein L13 [Spirochaetes bacterium GWF1_51_8]|nr:MAG: 50S ribosomal protein L13 [Spirochaetes bacterium GWF1_51_8]
MNTPSISSKNVTRTWYVIDAKGKPLGRIAAAAAMVLMGKHKPEYTPHIDNGDFVIVLNAGEFMLTGRKVNTKNYYHHSGFPGGLKTVVAKDMIERKPLFPMQAAVKGMLPKNKLARQMIKKLILIEGGEHTYKNVPLKTLEI